MQRLRGGATSLKHYRVLGLDGPNVSSEVFLVCSMRLLSLRHVQSDSVQTQGMLPMSHAKDLIR